MWRYLTWRAIWAPAASTLAVQDPRPNPEASYFAGEMVETLITAVGELTPRLRTAIELRELADLSTRETARRIGVSVGAVKARVFQGRKHLRKALSRRQTALTGQESTLDRSEERRVGKGGRT